MKMVYVPSKILFSIVLLTLPIIGFAQAVDKINSAPRSVQKKAFRAIINRSGNSCQKVTSIQFKGMHKNKEGHYAISCSSGNNYFVVVNNNRKGGGRVMTCTMLEAIADVECWGRY